MKNLSNEQLVQLWSDYGAALLLGVGTLGMLALLGFVIYARKKEKRLRPIALSVSMNLALLLNAEGMWVVARDKLHLAPQFAILVFAVFEILFLNATGLAAERYHATTVRDANGKIVTAGHPGKMVWVAFGIAVFSGLIVASNAPSGTEKMLRLGIPVTIFAMWWAALTAEGQTAKRGRFAYSPRRIAERYGWIIGDADPEFDKLAHDRMVKKIVVYGDRVRSNLPPARLWEWRAGRLARSASEAVVTEVLEQLARQDRFMDMIAPGRVAARGQSGPLALPGTVPALAAGQTAAAERADGRADVFDEADTRPLFEGDDPSADAPGDHGGQTPAAPRAAGPDARADTANGHRAFPSPIGSGPAWPVAQRDSGSEPAPAAERTADQNGEQSEPTPEPVAVGSAGWRAAVERLSDATAQQMRPEDGSISGRGMRHLRQILAPLVPELPEAHVDAFIHDWWNARDGVELASDLPWEDLLPQPRPATGSQQWLVAVERLSKELADVLRPDDLLGQGGRGAFQLAELLAPKVPELDKDVVVGFIGDYALAMTGQPPVAGMPWTEFLPPIEPLTGLTDEEVLRRFGDQLRRELRAQNRLTSYRVGQVTRASRRQSDRITQLLMQEHLLSMAGDAR